MQHNRNKLSRMALDPEYINFPHEQIKKGQKKK